MGGRTAAERKFPRPFCTGPARAPPAGGPARRWRVLDRRRRMGEGRAAGGPGGTAAGRATWEGGGGPSHPTPSQSSNGAHPPPRPREHRAHAALPLEGMFSVRGSLSPPSPDSRHKPALHALSLSVAEITTPHQCGSLAPIAQLRKRVCIRCRLGIERQARQYWSRDRCPIRDHWMNRMRCPRNYGRYWHHCRGI